MLIPPKEIEYKIDEYPEGKLKLIQMNPNGKMIIHADAILEVDPLNGEESWDCQSKGDIGDNAKFTNKEDAVSYLWSLRPQPVNKIVIDVGSKIGMSEEEFTEKVFDLLKA